MLIFNPKLRITAEEALKDPYFDEIRIPEQEEEVPEEFNLPFDETELSEEALKELLIKELEEGYDAVGLFE